MLRSRIWGSGGSCKSKDSSEGGYPVKSCEVGAWKTTLLGSEGGREGGEGTSKSEEEEKFGR